MAIIPSRGRPENIKRFCEASKETEAQIDLFVGVDDDDIKLLEYLSLSKEYDFTVEIGPRIRFGPTLNKIAMKYKDNYDYLWWGGDDHIPKTKFWDKYYREELNNLGIGIAYGDDLIQGPAIPTQMAMTTDIINALGYCVPPKFVHMFIDNYFLELGKALDKITYMPEIIIQHMHHCVGNAQEDKTYIEANSHYGADQARFNEYMNNELEIDVQKVKKII